MAQKLDLTGLTRQVQQAREKAEEAAPPKTPEAEPDNIKPFPTATKPPAARKAVKSKTDAPKAKTKKAMPKPAPAVTNNLDQPRRDDLLPKQVNIPAEYKLRFEILSRQFGFKEERDFFCKLIDDSPNDREALPPIDALQDYPRGDRKPKTLSISPDHKLRFEILSRQLGFSKEWQFFCALLDHYERENN